MTTPKPDAQNLRWPQTTLYEALRQAEIVRILLEPGIERIGCRAKNVLPNVQAALKASTLPQVPHSGMMISKEEVQEPKSRYEYIPADVIAELATIAFKNPGIDLGVLIGTLDLRFAEMTTPLPSPGAQAGSEFVKTVSEALDKIGWIYESDHSASKKLDQVIEILFCVRHDLISLRTSAVAPAEVPQPGKEKE